MLRSHASAEPMFRKRKAGAELSTSWAPGVPVHLIPTEILLGQLEKSCLKCTEPVKASCLTDDISLDQRGS